MDEKKKLNSAGFCAVLGLLMLLAGVGGYLLLQDRPAADLPPEEAEVTDMVRQPAVTPARTQPAPHASAQARMELPEAPAVQAVEPAAPVIPEKPVLPEKEPGLVVYPVSGHIVAAFSADELQYSETFEDWRTHDGIDLEAKQGTSVLAASAGTVLSVADDPLMGTTVRIEHTGGYRTTYANLQSRPPVTAGDEVSAGQIIGAVGDTAAAECGQPPHLHFGVEKDDVWVDPEAFLNP